MTQNKSSVNGKPSLGGYTLTILTFLRELVMAVIVSDYLVRGLGYLSPLGSSYLHVVEDWHIWIAISAYVVVGLILSNSLWENSRYLRAIFRRIVRTYRAATA